MWLLNKFHPEELSPSIKLGGHQPSGQPATLGASDLRTGLSSSCGKALILEDSNSEGAAALEAACVLKEEALDKPGSFLPKTPQGGQQRHWTSLLSQDLDRALCPLCASSVPSKDKRRHGFAL